MTRAIRNYSSIQLSTELLTKIFSHITVQDTGYKTPCWLWHAHDLTQYSLIRWNRAVYSVHRLMYYLFVEPIEHPLHTDHLCRIPTCINPSHLEAVSAKENTLRGVGPSAKNVLKSHCPQGHPYSGNNVRHNLTLKRVVRVCRTCARDKATQNRREQGVIPKHDRSEICPKGHPLVGDNLYIRPNSTYRDCRQCRYDTAKARRRKQGVREFPTTHCYRGHEYTSENTYISKNGARHCHACQKIRRG